MQGWEIFTQLKDRLCILGQSIVHFGKFTAYRESNAPWIGLWLVINCIVQFDHGEFNVQMCNVNLIYKILMPDFQPGGLNVETGRSPHIYAKGGFSRNIQLFFSSSPPWLHLPTEYISSHCIRKYLSLSFY